MQNRQSFSFFDNQCTKIVPIMQALCSMLLAIYYAPNYAGISGAGLICNLLSNNQTCLHNSVFEMNSIKIYIGKNMHATYVYFNYIVTLLSCVYVQYRVVSNFNCLVFWITKGIPHKLILVIQHTQYHLQYVT